jgi:hypothetical protein
MNINKNRTQITRIKRIITDLISVNQFNPLNQCAIKYI